MHSAFSITRETSVVWNGSGIADLQALPGLYSEKHQVVVCFIKAC
jgi:hypothetical protein